MTENQTRVEELTSLISEASKDYHNGQSKVSDEVYDAWVDELSEIDSLNQVLAQVGAIPTVSEWKKVSHDQPMGSLNKVNSTEEVLDWIQSYAPDEDLLLSEKLDGISISVRWFNGKLTQASTRGDGKIGEDITQNVLRMQGILKTLPNKTSCCLRGEILLRKSDFSRLPSGEYSNTRNATSGISKRYDGTHCDFLTVKFYRVLSGPSFSTKKEEFNFIESLGLQTPWWTISGLKVGMKTPQDIWLHYQQSKRDSLDYDIDGLVLEINDLNKQFSLGETNLRPVGAVAFKFAPATKETIATGVVEQTGSTGVITPVARFNQVNILGTNVDSASLYNWGYIQSLGFDIGAKILVARAGDVIPRILTVLSGTGTTYPTPTKCPSCGAPAAKKGEFYVCTNRDSCPAQVIGRLSQWVTSLGVLEWGEVLLEKLVNSGLVKTIPDLYRLTAGQVSGLDRMGETSAVKVLRLLHEKTSLTLDLLLGSLSIPGIASSTVKLFMDSGLDSIEALRSASLSRLEKVTGIGPIRAGTIFEWLRDSSSIVEELASVGVVVQAPIRGAFSGKYFCFTGTTKIKREDLESMVRAQGGEVEKRVTKKLTYLVLADTTTTKAATARKYGTKCLSEDEFLALVSG
jgi:DNA ligase (NAD+)